MAAQTSALAAQAVQLDEHLTNGRRYTFQFQLAQIFSPSATTVLNDLNLTSQDVAYPGVTFDEGLTAYFMNVAFTYQGDGTDTISDLANQILAALLAGSNDAFEFVAAYSGAGSTIPGTPPSQNVPTPAAALGMVGTATVQAAGGITQEAASQAGGTVNKVLGGLLPTLAVATILLLLLLPVIGKNVKLAAA